MQRALIIGSNGQIGSDLYPYLKKQDTIGSIYCLDLEHSEADESKIIGDVLDRNLLDKVINEKKITQIYHLAAILSAAGEKDPEKTWILNMDGLKNVLDLARIYGCMVFWPSSIAVFGSTTPKDKTPQHTILEPSTMYGITKLAGELLCQYYYMKYNVDVRSVRFPGIISYKTHPGGGTSDYSVAVFRSALEEGSYISYVGPDTQIPLMYIHDALRVIHEIMQAKSGSLSIRTSYNVAGAHFTAKQLYDELAKHIPVTISYDQDFRQGIADSWPNSIDDTVALQDWGWKAQFTLSEIVEDMLLHLQHA